MLDLTEQTFNVNRDSLRVLRGGSGAATAIIFLHGGLPGITPFCSGAHIWEGSVDKFAENQAIILPDLPGSGGSDHPREGALTVEAIGRRILSLFDQLSVHRCHVVGHDLGGLLGIWLAMEAPDRLRSLSIVASSMCTPTGDQLDDILLANPPPPLWSRASQAWALDRLSYEHLHITASLLEACVHASSGDPHHVACSNALVSGGSALKASIDETKARLWETCRHEGIRVPTQLIWGTHDPTTTQEAGFVLFKVIAGRQPAAQFHIINRAGGFPFREQPEAFYHMVSAFQAGASA